jgi:hypothetical protein
MAILLVRANFDDVVVKPPPAALPHEVGDIFEVRLDGHYLNSASGCGWLRDIRTGKTHGRWTTYQFHVPGIPGCPCELMIAQERHTEPEWISGDKRDHHRERGARPAPEVSWVRGCWLDLDALDARHKLYLEQTGQCWLTRWEVESIFNTMTDSVSADLSRHTDV